MRTKYLLLLAPIALALTACHSRGGYMSADPALTYGPGVVEFPDPARVYLPEYRRGAVATTTMVVEQAPVAYRAPAVRAPAPRTIVTRGDPSAAAIRASAPVVRAQPPAFRVRQPALRVQQPTVQVRQPTVTVPVAPRVTTSRPANVESLRGESLRGTELVLDRPVAPNIGEVRVRGERLPPHMISRTTGVVTSPPKGAPLPAPTTDRPFRETEVIVTPGGVYTR